MSLPKETLHLLGKPDDKISISAKQLHACVTFISLRRFDPQSDFHLRKSQDEEGKDRWQVWSNTREEFLFPDGTSGCVKPRREGELDPSPYHPSLDEAFRACVAYWRRKQDGENG